MHLIVAAHSGFCFGVKRAVDLAMQCARGGGRVYTLGPIIHNEAVLARLKENGVSVAESLEEPGKGDTLILRAHGVPPELEKSCRERVDHVLDATCPFVKRIHRIAEKAREQGVPLYVAGSHDHPEVQGILGYAGMYGQALEHEEDIPEKLPEAAVLVAQTTCDRTLFSRIRERLSAGIAALTVYDTICDTTRQRQAETAMIAARADMVAVIGSKTSANTGRLYEIAKKICDNTVFVDNPKNFFLENLHTDGIIGLVAGASTPDWMIMEVIELMSELENTTIETVEAVVEETVAAEVPAVVAAPADVDDASDFAKAFAESENVKIHNGSIITGTVMYVKDGDVYVAIPNYKKDGVILREDFSSDPNADPSKLNEGDEIEVEVLSLKSKESKDGGDSPVRLSAKNVEGKKLWDDLMAEAENNADKIYDATGKEVVKGGLIADLNGIRAFVPASQVSTKFIADLTQYVGKPMRVKILEVDKQRKRVVASQKQVLVAEAAEAEKAKWEAIKQGEKVNGIVRRITDFGAFVDIGGVDGLVHVTDCGWGHVKHPSDVLSIGQEVEVLVLNVDAAKKRVSLGYKQLQPKPWTTAAERYAIGSIVEGKVVRIVPFGAFVALESTIDGLIHISQVGVRRIAKVEDEINVGDVVRCKVLEVNQEAKRISLSRKEAILEEQPEVAEQLKAEREERDRQYQERKAEREKEREQQQTQRRERQERSAQSAAPRQERSRGPRHSEDGDYELPEVQSSTTSLADLLAGLKVDE